MEIERKFIPKNLPVQLNDCDCILIEQAYISTNPVIRIRKKVLHPAQASGTDARYVLTVKSPGMMARQEFELAISEEAYTGLLSKVSGNVITKRRYLIPLEDALTLELDVFDNIFGGLTIGEIEFPDEETAKKYTPPAYLAEEVTYDARFHNSTLSAMLPQDISDLISWVHEHH